MAAAGASSAHDLKPFLQAAIKHEHLSGEDAYQVCAAIASGECTWPIRCLRPKQGLQTASRCNAMWDVCM
jgi:hypothetical protein